MGDRFNVPENGRLRISTMSGGVHVIAEDRPDVDIEPPGRHVRVEDGHVLDVRSKSGSLTVRCPTGTNVSVGVMSGSVALEGEFGSVKIAAVSGSIDVDTTRGDLDVRNVSGSLSVNACGGRCQLNTKSGQVRIGHVDGAAKISTISGTISVGTAGQDDVDIRTVSGKVVIGVAEGRAPHARLRSFAGKTRCDCPQGDDFEIKAHSISGSIEIEGLAEHEQREGDERRERHEHQHNHRHEAHHHGREGDDS